MMHKSCSPSDFYTELQATDLLSYADVPGAIDLHRTYRGVFQSDIYFHFEVKKKIQICKYVHFFNTQNHETSIVILWIFFLKTVNIYNRKWDSQFQNSIDLHVQFYLQYFQAGMSRYIFRRDPD